VAQKWLEPKEVARRRIIDEFVLDKGKGHIVVCGKRYNIEQMDDILDLGQFAEMIMLRHTGKVLRPQFRPYVKNRAALRPCVMRGGDYSLGSQGAPLPATTLCGVTGLPVPTHFLRTEIQGTVWESWFGRADELAKCAYNIVKEAQGDEYEHKPMALIGAKGAVPFEAPGAGNA